MHFRPSLYFHTIRYLKPVQIYGRLLFRCFTPKPDVSPAPPLRERLGSWVSPARRNPSLLGPETFLFLGLEAKLSEVGWDGPPMERLWRYNQHYFDDLNAFEKEHRRAWQSALLERWVKENPPGQGVGWEPYPTALRMVNWIKWALGGETLSAKCLWSLALQARWLARRLEFHLLGNHLFVEAKALIFAGVFFKGEEAKRWLLKGIQIWKEQMAEQILPDGGHFERSPMYHSLVLEDLLDMCNLLRCFGQPISHYGAFGVDIERKALLMRKWLSLMGHPDGEIAFFNDAAVGIAPAPEEIEAYALRLGMPPLDHPVEGLQHLKESGYIRWSDSRAVCLLDAGHIGPDYLPGHAHADTLSFELSLGLSRVLVNSGTSCYGSGPERLRQRGTAAHNTVVVDDMDSSEVWAGFRVARRAKPVGLKILEEGAWQLRVSCAHDGYKKLAGGPIHKRSWTLRKGGLLVEDEVLGPHKKAEARFHFHPDCIMHLEEGGKRGKAKTELGEEMLWEVEKGFTRMVDSTYHPSFGVSRYNRCLVVSLQNGKASIRFSWS